MKNNKNKISIVFIGTSDFGIPSLNALIKGELFDIIGVITQPDKKAGRGQILAPPPIKIAAIKNNIPIWQPAKISNFPACHRLCLRQMAGRFQISKIDLIVLVAYAQIIPKKMLNIPKYGIINIHPSLLPKYRGAACVQAAIKNGDKETGVTIMKLNDGLDTGPILFQNKIKIDNSDTAGILFDKLAKISSEILIPTLKGYINGYIKPRVQDNTKASYVGILKRNDGLINWHQPADVVERFIRAMTPWPSAFSKINNKILKISEVEHQPLKINKYKTGELFLDNNQLAVQCGEDALAIKKLQLSGKKEMLAEEFIRGHKNFIGKILG
ncbi:methionyl-tRNA formyltransferase [Candidatus Falkowbacteria bacterium CG_4_9_14_3_um_filter_36_9]|uniref:Methionyl-tRNA formyltransferase n=1 Tax=Candidatus Falkowbacteria bacterium CG02_land_8_20_14_3_00_36_14 TaxID=1974560 RepID=A0A2M7DMI9_9BACT|nr:MAG: methionyl-tRNA formyltransferase [Candidatus Falkowbacteria bacterium CG02_land_8_20_14_3_00_36_14]PIX11238.1 MAG: methionyl-tRNA formyltransferase [Candidatus Falkowbacteria bacterium CG_4_8_14_3_um_filter_36_11]PJA10180.1 MAG: methionyl-tRNA formyltransferase [Candidatus Falkowbacteria bacterium CG_4_10_14_0_2_um_filter_36_22]PJB20841.1 MAG: methionyl-tRNA formyltransferase [Candidatus Falkowbacteria bacterium CG_4_9_14_3_um_filter_36_9]